MTELDEMRRNYEDACQTIAQMHGVAVGGFGKAPVRGVVEDVADLRTQKDGAYAERNRCVALIARMALALGLRAGVREHPAEDTMWENDWRTIVFIDLPTGQASWHFHDSEKHLLGGLPRYPHGWDGHSTEEKYARVGRAFTELTP